MSCPWPASGALRKRVQDRMCRLAGGLGPWLLIIGRSQVTEGSAGRRDRRLEGADRLTASAEPRVDVRPRVPRDGMADQGARAAAGRGDRRTGPRASRAGRADGDPPAKAPATNPDPPAPGRSLEGHPVGQVAGKHEDEPAVRSGRLTAGARPGSPIAEPPTPVSGPATYPDGYVTRSAG